MRSSIVPSTKQVWRAVLLPVALAVGVLLPAGCNILGAAAYIYNGPEKTPAVFMLPPERITVMFIDDRSSQASRVVRTAMGTTAEKALLENKAVVDMVESKAVQLVTSREKDKKLLTKAAVGKAVGAQTVIYAFVDYFSLSSDGQTYSPLASLRVSVIDVESGKRLFPPPDVADEYFPLNVTIPAQAGAAPASVSAISQAEIGFGRVVGTAIAEMFYDHVPTNNPNVSGSGKGE